MKGDELKITNNGEIRTIRIINEYSGGSKIAQDENLSIFSIEREKWRDIYGNYWEVIAQITS